MPDGNKLTTHNLLFDCMPPTADASGVLDGFGFSGVHGQAPNGAALDGTYLTDSGEVDSDGEPILVDTPFDNAGRDTTIHLPEADAYADRGNLSLFGELGYGQQEGAAISNSGVLRDARWWGLSGRAAYLLRCGS